MNTIDTDKKTVKVTHKTRCSDTPEGLKGEDNPCKEYNTVFDFSNCSDEEILNLAAKTCIIAFRTRAKVNVITEEAFAKMQEDAIDVHEAMKAERKGMSAAEKVAKLMSTMNSTERQAIMDAYKKK